MDSSLKILEVPNELVEFIENCSNFVIAGHKEPDGDCVGSQLALRSALMRMGKKVIVCKSSPFKRKELKKFEELFVSIPAEEFERQGWQPKETRVIIIDCTGRERTGEIQGFIEKFPCAIIDHHAAVTYPSSTKDAPVYNDAKSPSCTLLIQKLITALDLDVTEEEASLLLFGLCTDTGFFRHLNENNAASFEAAANMIRCGASPKKIYGITNGGKSLNSRILIGHILTRLESHFDGKLLLSTETLEESDTFGLEGRDSDALYQMILTIEGVEAALIIRQESAENCTVSLRSTDKIDVSQVAAIYGGGGHKNASGLTMKGDISSVKEKMLKSFKNIFT